MRLIKFEDLEFPENLKNIKNPPKKIWVNGNIELLNKNSIAIIGSRNCSSYGEKWCEKFTKDLLEYDLAIVSGMAIGIDSIAHNTALKYGGKTIAVLPTGLKNIYPKENIKLYENIIENNGLILSEYSPDEKPSKEKFLERNRIVSGLSIGVLVIEAAFRSGTSVTANLTRKEGKEVFCVPGSLENSKSVGTNMMIKKGANLVTSVDDIISHYNFLHKTRTIKENNIVNFVDFEEIDDIDDEYKDVYNVISKVPLDINSIVRMCNTSIGDVMNKLTMLEIDGKINRVEGNKFVKNKEVK